MPKDPEARLKAFRYFQLGRRFEHVLDWLTFQEGKRVGRAALLEWWFDAGLLQIQPTMESLYERQCSHVGCSRPMVLFAGPNGLCRQHRWLRKTRKSRGVRHGPLPESWPVGCTDCGLQKQTGVVMVTFYDGLGGNWDGNFICRECFES